jgi:5-(carboxyamino)imidazole ribonucleotide synthase
MIGLMGGGQLGRMMIQAAHAMGEKVAVLDPDAQGPAAQLADSFIAADYADYGGLAKLASCASVFTTEFENVPAESLRFLARHGLTFPDANAVAIAQNRIDEKRFMVSAGVDVAPHAVIMRLEDIDDVPEHLFPGILKTARLGYDGKGQQKVHDAQEARQAWMDLGSVACVLEKMLPLEREISVICARDRNGGMALFPVGENTHRNGILAVTEVPARISETLRSRAGEAACRIAESLSYVGVLCVEFFVLSGDRLLANEIAPRPHNSGHHSIESCHTSQFEQQVRICIGQPLGSTELLHPVVMLNVLGDSWFRTSDKPVEPDWDAVRALRGVHLHLYGKAEPRPGRKMAHVTCLGETAGGARRRAELVADILGLDVGRALVRGV